MCKEECKSEEMKYRLAEAVKVCMKTTSVEKITVKEIVDACGTTRQTFYRHFQDKYDLVNWYFDRFFWNHLNIWEKARPSIRTGEKIPVYSERETFL